MTPGRIPTQDPGILGYAWLIMGGLIGRIVQGEAFSWAKVAGISGAILLLSLGIIGWMTNRGVDSLTSNMMRIEGKVDGTNKLVVDLCIAHAAEKEKNNYQTLCIEKIEKELDKMRGVKSPRLGGGELGDSK